MKEILKNRYIWPVILVALMVMTGYSFLSSFDLKLALGFLGAGILFCWFWYDIRIGLWTLLVSVLVGQIVRLNIGGGGLLVSDGVMVVLAVVWILNILVRKKSFRGNILWLAVLGFWFLSLLVNIWKTQFYNSEVIDTMWLYWGRWVLYSLTLPISWSIVEWYGQRDRYLRWFWWVGILFLVIGFIQLKLLPDISFLTKYGWDPHQGRLLSTFLDPNFAGAFLVIFFALSFSVYFYYQKWSLEKIIWGIFSVLFMAGIVLTLSRSAFLAAGIVFVVLTWVNDKRLLILGLFVGLTMIVNNPRLSERVTGIFSVDETASLRIQSWEDSLAIVQDNYWTGIGYNTLAYEQLHRGFIEDINVHSASGSDSSYLTVWSTLGLSGLIIFCLIFVLFFGIVFCQCCGQTKRTKEKYLLMGILLGIAGVMLHAQFTNSLFYVHILIPVWFLMGMVMRENTFKLSKTLRNT